MKKIYKLYIGIILSVIAVACSDKLDSDKYFKDRRSLEDVFTDKENTEEWLANAYSYLGGYNLEVYSHSTFSKRPCYPLFHALIRKNTFFQFPHCLFHNIGKKIHLKRTPFPASRQTVCPYDRLSRIPETFQHLPQKSRSFLASLHQFSLCLYV